MPANEIPIAVTETDVDLGGVLHTMLIKNSTTGTIRLKFQRAEVGYLMDSGEAMSIEAPDTSDSSPNKIVTEHLYLTASVAGNVNLIWTTKGPKVG